MFNYNNFDYINLILYIIWKFLKRESIISSNLEYISAILFLIKTLDSIRINFQKTYSKSE